VAVNSRRKGKVGELEAAQVLRELFGWECGRSVQHSGTQDSADLRVSDTPGLWFEVKRVEALSVPKTMKKAVEQAGRKTPVLLHRTNRSPVGWLLTIRLIDLPRLAHAFDVAQGVPLASPQVPNNDPGQDTGGAKPAGDVRALPCNQRESHHPIEQDIGTHDGRDSAGGMGPRSAARMSGSLRRGRRP